MKKITKRDAAVAHEYRLCKPKQFGNLHERMKFVMGLIDKTHNSSTLGERLWDAMFDLETEVKFHRPAAPPYGRRSVDLGRS